MRTRKKEILQHLIRQIPPFLVTAEEVIPHWFAVSGQHLGDGRFVRDAEQGRPLSLGDSWTAGYDETVWFSADCCIPEAMLGRKTVLELDFGGEAIVRINGQIAGGVSSDRCGWVYRDQIFLPDPLPTDRMLHIEVEAAINSGAFYDAVVANGGSRITYTLAKARLICVDEATESYLADVQAVWDALPQIADPAVSARVYAALDDSLHRLDFDFEPEVFYASVPEAAAMLWEQIGRIQDHPQAEVIMTGHSHIDVAWLWTVRETTRKCGRTFSNTLALMRRYPDFIFAQSQAYLYDKTREVYPELYEQIKEAVARGQWVPVGNAWVEADTNLASGESLIRQLLYGHTFFKREFGVSSDIYWLPDCFGFTWALPQIIRRSGMKYFVTAKLNGQDTNRFPHTVFRWRGMDGSEVLAYLQRTAYSGEYDAAKISASWYANDEKDVTDTVMGMFGYGDGGGGATYGMLEQAHRLSRIPGIPASRIGHPEEFFHRVESSREELPVWEDEMYYENHRGTFTSLGFVKQNNRRGEFLLTRAEMAAVMAGLPAEEILHGDLSAAWRLLLLNQFHDILPGTAIHEQYDDTRRQYAEMHRLGQAVLQRSLATIASEIRLDEDSVVCFNFLAHPVSGIISLRLPAGFPASDNGVPFACLESRENGERVLSFLPDEPIPAMGYRVFRLVAEAAVPSAGVFADSAHLENEYLRVILDENGEIISIYDKEAGRETLDGIGNRLVVYQDKPVHESAWNLEADYCKKSWPLTKADVIEPFGSGSIRAGIRITRTFHLSRITQEITLDRRSRQLDFRTTVDWQEREKILRASFDVACRASFGTYEIAHGAICRPTHVNTSYDLARFEVCAHKWIDLSEGGYGVSLLNDCKYGHDIHNSTLSISLLRAPVCPDPTGDQERHSFTYSYFPHTGTWQEAGTVRAALALNQPVIAVPADAHPGIRPTASTLLDLDFPSLVMEALKPAEDGDGVILRVCETEARRGEAAVTVHFPVASVCECNLMEEEEQPPMPLTDGRFTFFVRPFEVRTFRLRSVRK